MYVWGPAGFIITETHDCLLNLRIKLSHTEMSCSCERIEDLDYDKYINEDHGQSKVYGKGVSDHKKSSFLITHLKINVINILINP